MMQCHVHPCTTSQPTVSIIKLFYLCPTIIYPFPIAKNSYLCPKKFCFIIANAKFETLKKSNKIVVCKYTSWMRRISILELLSFYYWKEKSFTFTENQHHAVWRESNDTSRWTEEKEEGGWEKGWTFCATPPCLWNGKNSRVFPVGWGWVSKYSLPWHVQTDTTREDGAASVWQNMPGVWQLGSVRCKCTSGVQRSSPPKQTLSGVSTAHVPHLEVLLAIYR